MTDAAAAAASADAEAEVRAWLRLLDLDAHADALIEDGWEDMRNLEHFNGEEDAAGIGLPAAAAEVIARATAVRRWVREIGSPPAGLTDPARCAQLLLAEGYDSLDCVQRVT